MSSWTLADSLQQEVDDLSMKVCELMQENEELKTELAVYKARHKKMTADQAKEALRDLMRSISEDCYCAGWMCNLEYDLWRMVQGGPRNYGFGEIPEDVVNVLRKHSETCDGWWHWPEGADGEQFISMADWLPISLICEAD